MWENHECCFISSSDRSSSRRTVIASGNRVLVGADGAVVEVTSCRAFWPLLNGQQLLLTILTR